MRNYYCPAITFTMFMLTIKQIEMTNHRSWQEVVDTSWKMLISTKDGPHDEVVYGCAIWLSG